MSALTLCVPSDETAQAAGRILITQFAAAGIEVKTVIDDEPFIPSATNVARADICYWIWHPRDPAIAWPTLLEQPHFQGLLSARSRTLYDELLRAKDAAALATATIALETELLTDRRLLALLHLPEFSARRKTVTDFGKKPLDPFQHVSDWKTRR
ncbi:MAG: hypothetical protein QM811_15165 [Pirellulales bacterium]